MTAARKARNRIHAVIVGSGMNQDGRTTGLSLPSADSQRRLLEQVYGDFSVDPADLTFVEAHGTGTRVGDPIEADALGKGLAQRRSQPLPIGSVKSNIGHLEPVSGLAGVVKSVMALKHGVVPATLHQQAPSPDIPFDKLNLKVVDRNWRPPRETRAVVGWRQFVRLRRHQRARDPTQPTMRRSPSFRTALTNRRRCCCPRIRTTRCSPWQSPTRATGRRTSVWRTSSSAPVRTCARPPAASRGDPRRYGGRDPVSHGAFCPWRLLAICANRPGIGQQPASRLPVLGQRLAVGRHGPRRLARKPTLPGGPVGGRWPLRQGPELVDRRSTLRRRPGAEAAPRSLFAASVAGLAGSRPCAPWKTPASLRPPRLDTASARSPRLGPQAHSASSRPSTS